MFDFDYELDRYVANKKIIKWLADGECGVDNDVVRLAIRDNFGDVLDNNLDLLSALNNVVNCDNKIKRDIVNEFIVILVNNISETYLMHGKKYSEVRDISEELSLVRG